MAARPSRARLTGALILAAIAASGYLAGCLPWAKVAEAQRIASIPADVVKGSPQTDPWPPVLHCPDWLPPVPLQGPVNTAGAEDSPYVTWDGNELYFFFANDVRVGAGIQIRNRVNGIWRSVKMDGEWGEPERVLLTQTLALDGCQVVHGDVMWFASARPGNHGEIDIYTARRVRGRWTGWRNAGRQLNVTWSMGEFHVMPDGQTLYFAAELPGGHGKQDIWVSTKVGDAWGEPVNLGPAVNTDKHDAQPFVTPDGSELWFTRESSLDYPGPAVWRSVKGPDGAWGQAEEIISQFAGEPCLDQHGNIYFVHHFFSKDLTRMIEADIYIARKANNPQAGKD